MDITPSQQAFLSECDEVAVQSNDYVYEEWEFDDIEVDIGQENNAKGGSTGT